MADIGIKGKDAQKYAGGVGVAVAVVVPVAVVVCTWYRFITTVAASAMLVIKCLIPVTRAHSYY